MSFTTSALIVTWVALLLMALVLSGLVRQVHLLSKRVGLQRSAYAPSRPGLAPGSPAPGLDRLGRGTEGTVLLFVSQNCRTCVEVQAEAAGLVGQNGTALHVLYRDGEQAELFDAYDAIATPFAVLIDARGRVVDSEPVGSRAALRALLGDVLEPTKGGNA